jgi:hypothetical protein
MRTIVIVLAIFAAGCVTRRPADEPGVTVSFQQCCKTYREPGFQKRLEQIVPAGSSADRYRTLFSQADQVREQYGNTLYTYDPGGALAGGQGLMVFILVDIKKNTIRKVEWNIAGH